VTAVTARTDPSPPTVRPTDLAGASAALAGAGGRVLVRGAGTAADWAGDPEPPGLVLDTTGLSGVLAHNPSDMTVAVGAGTPLRELNGTLAGHGQQVALDCARVGLGATVGGLVATGDAGPAALLYGSPRDLVIGATLVLADGTVARTGGHVIKNVAGYDLTKLMHGSHGAFALLAEVVLRLHPLPEATATVRLECELDRAPGAARAVAAGPFEPVAAEWFDDGLHVRLQGHAAVLPGRVRRLAELLGGHGVVRVPGPAEAARCWARHAELVSRPGDGAVLRVGTRPSRLAGLLGALGGRAVVAGLLTGVGTVVLPAEPDAVAAAHRAVHAAGGDSTLRSRPAGVSGLPGWGPAPTAVGVLRALKRELDPAGRLGAGRFGPWLTHEVRTG
jgi:glycolate oxidase FAD binding subunit